MLAQSGIMLNNMLGEGDLNAGGFHHWTENQRMTSMMAPSLIRKTNGDMIATGSGGSNRIRSALLQVINNLMYFDMDVTDAVLSSRIHWDDNKLSVEGGFAPQEIDRLMVDYHENERWDDRNLFFGGAHTVMSSDGQFTGAGDPRRGGVCRVLE